MRESELAELKKEVEKIGSGDRGDHPRRRADRAEQRWTRRRARRRHGDGRPARSPPPTPTLRPRRRRPAGAGHGLRRQARSVCSTGGARARRCNWAASDTRTSRRARPQLETAPARLPRPPTEDRRERAEPMQDEPIDTREGHDEIEASKAPLMDHLIELRQRLIYALIGVGIGFVICFAFATADLQPAGLALPGGARRGAEDRDDLHRPARVLLHQAEAGAVRRGVPGLPDHRHADLQVRRARPLQERARRPSGPTCCATFVLFIAGALVVYFVVMPLAMKFFLSMEQTGGQVEIHLQARVSEYLSLIMTLILGFGIMFQLPVVLTPAGAGRHRHGAQNLRGFPPLRHRRHHRGGRRAVAARSLQHDRHGAAHHPALRGRASARGPGGEAMARQAPPKRPRTAAPS